MKAVRQRLNHHPNESFLAYRYDEPHFYAPYHFHPECEIVMIESGRGLRVVGDHTGSFAPMEVCLFGPNLPHIFRADFSTKRAKSCVIQFRNEIFESFFSLPEMQSLQEMLNRASIGLRFEGEGLDSARSRIRQLVDGNNRSNKVLQLVEILEILGNSCIQQTLASPGYVPHPTDEGSHRIAQVWQLILESSSVEPTQAQVAEEVGMSVSSFSRMFRRATGKTYSETIIELRLGRACRLMEASELSIAEAGYTSGFNSLSIFNRHFKKRYGMTPRQWRRTLKPFFDSK